MTAPVAIADIRLDRDVTSTVMRAGVPPRHAGARFAQLEQRRGAVRAMRAAQRSAAEARGLVLIGPFGTGKTTLGAAIVAERASRWLNDYPTEIVGQDAEGIVARPPFRTRFSAVPELLDAIRRSYEYADEPDPLVRLRESSMLVLDDLGRERATDWVLERLYVLVDHRYAHLLPTVVTTNFSLDELARTGYGAMISRLVEGVDVVTMTASDRRREEAR